jgi:hypothetical protein
LALQWCSAPDCVLHYTAAAYNSCLCHRSRHCPLATATIRNRTRVERDTNNGYPTQWMGRSMTRTLISTMANPQWVMCAGLRIREWRRHRRGHGNGLWLRCRLGLWCMCLTRKYTDMRSSRSYHLSRCSLPPDTNCQNIHSQAGSRLLPRMVPAPGRNIPTAQMGL